MIVNLEFLAGKANVSKSLVSKVLNEKPVRVSESKRNLIIELARKYNYTPNRMASALRTKRTHNIAVIVPTISFDFFGVLAYGCQMAAIERGYNLIIFNSSEDLIAERNYLEMYKMGMIDGLIASPSDNDVNVDLYVEMKNMNFPFVFVDRYIEGLGISYVATDGYSGTYTLTQSLIQGGHSNILCICHGRSLNTSAQIKRYQAYCDAMKLAGYKTQYATVDDNIPIEEQEFFKIIKAPNRPTALVLISSWDVKYILKALVSLSLSIPQDISISIFDSFTLPFTTVEDIKTASIITKPLEIMQQDPEELGKIATNILIDKIENKNLSVQEVLLPAQYIQPK